jgi:antirestriction protein
VDGTTVGNWIAHEDGLAGHVEAATLPTLFAAAYVGRYPDRDTYARACLDERGVGKAIIDLGIEAYFDHRAYERDVFRYEAIAIDPGDYHRRDRGIQVFRRPSRQVAARQVAAHQ